MTDNLLTMCLDAVAQNCKQCWHYHKGLCILRQVPKSKNDWCENFKVKGENHGIYR